MLQLKVLFPNLPRHEIIVIWLIEKQNIKPLALLDGIE